MIESTSNRAEVRARIIEAAARLLRDQGPGAVTTRGVAEQAGVQAPAIYRLFGDKDGLMDAVAEQVMASFVSAKATTLQAASDDDLDPVDDLGAGWQAQIDFGIANPTLSVLMSDPERGLQSAAAQSGRRILEARVHRIALAGQLRVSERRAVDLIHAAGTGAVLTILASPPEHRDPKLAEDLFAAVLHHILANGSALTDRRPTASAIALRAAVSQLDVLSDGEQRLLAEWLDRVIQTA